MKLNMFILNKILINVFVSEKHISLNNFYKSQFKVINTNFHLYFKFNFKGETITQKSSCKK